MHPRPEAARPHLDLPFGGRLEPRDDATTCTGTIGAVSHTGDATFPGAIDHVGLVTRGLAGVIRYAIVYTD